MLASVELEREGVLTLVMSLLLEMLLGLVKELLVVIEPGVVLLLRSPGTAVLGETGGRGLLLGSVWLRRSMITVRPVPESMQKRMCSPSSPGPPGGPGRGPGRPGGGGGGGGGPKATKD